MKATLVGVDRSPSPQYKCCIRCGKRGVIPPVRRGRDYLCADCRSVDKWFVAKIKEG